MLPRLLTALWRLNITPSGLAWIFLSIVLVYAYPLIIPSLNSDDVIQIQSIANDALTFLAQGRWGYFIVFEWLQDNNPGGLFYGGAGLAVLLLSSWIAARIIDFKHGISIYAFLLVSCISIYYGMLFDFSSTRLAYPLANLAALGGLWLCLNRRALVGTLIMALAPAFYPAASQLAGTVLICAMLAALLREGTLNNIGRFLWAGLFLVLSLVIYYLATKIGYQLLGIATNQRMSVSPFAVVDNLSVIYALLREHTFPFLCTGCLDTYRTLRWLLPLSAIFGLFLTVAILKSKQQPKLLHTILVIGLILASFFSPFALAFAGSSAPFPPRSLISLAILHGFWVAFVLDSVGERNTNFSKKHFCIAGSMLLAAFFYLFDSSAQINNFAYDKHLATQADILATNRIINRIELTAANEQRELLTPQPIVVIYDIPLPASPRGGAGTARQAPWSRGWIFRLISPQFMPNPQAEQLAREAASSRASWPSYESVFFLEDGTVVVIINQR